MVDNKCLPYKELDSGIRIFSKKTESSELEWHVDFEDRTITIIKSGGWLFQRDNDIPRKLSDGQVIEVKAFEWHRVIAGNSELVARILKKPVQAS